ncbi:tripartite motif-containing protein 75-like [Acipenser ruthenus]|uniref:tripartite motif-containing protein 75-like n=1 Tax=Acipenser ruthenus TaxID=7906 RepID=UPI0027422C13|nr:tripartite motif-containing protein 75-like [Acipenser ruthenus]
MNQTRNRFDPRNSSPGGGLNGDLVRNILNQAGQNGGQHIPDPTSKTSKPSKESGGKENFYKRTTQALAVLLLTTVTAGTGLHYSKMSRASTEYSSLLDSHTDLVQKLEEVKLDYSTLQERYAAIEEQLTSVHDKFTSLQGAHSDLRSKLMSGIQKYLPQGDSILRSIQENVLEKLPVDLSFNDNAESVEASSVEGYLEQGVELGSDDWVPVSEGRGLITGQDLTAEVKDDNSGSLISRAASFLSKLGVPAVVLSVFAYAFKKRGSIAGQLNNRLGKKTYQDSLSSKGKGFNDVLSENLVPVNAQNQHSSFVSGMAEKLREVNLSAVTDKLRNLKGSDMMKKLYDKSPFYRYFGARGDTKPLSTLEKPTPTYPEHLEAPTLAYTKSLEHKAPTFSERFEEPDSAYSSSFEKFAPVYSERFEKPAAVFSDRIDSVEARQQHSSVDSSKDQSPKDGVVLDPYTAYPKLILSRDGKRLRLGDETRAVSDDNPERFDYWECAVGQEGFTSGRHFWEVDVGQNQHWKLGVARASAQRKGEFSMLPRDGYWTLWWYGDQLWALTDPLTSLAPGLKVQKVGISLVYDEGRLSFYDVESGTLLYTFTDVFTEKLYPFFWTWDTSTDLVIL